MSDNKKPIHFLILKIVGLIGIALVVMGLIFIFTGFGDFESNSFMIGGMLLPFGAIMTGIGISIGFSPEFAKMRTKATKYIQQENKEDLTDIASNRADIMSGAVKKTAQAVKEGLEDSVYCRHCGAEIDADSVFCKKCGKSQ